MPSIADASLLVNIDNPNFRQVVAANPQFFVDSTIKSSEVKKFAIDGPRRLSDLLSFSGLFKVMDDNLFQSLRNSISNSYKASASSDWLQNITEISGAEWSSWRALGVESLTLATLRQEGEILNLVIKTFDVKTGKEVVAKKFTSVKNFEETIRQYADFLLEAYTGKSGIYQAKIAFVGRKTAKSEKQIYIADFDGSNMKQITRGNLPHVSPAWSPDGRYLAYTSWVGGSPEIYIYDTKSNRVQRLTNYKGLDSGANWAPNGKLIAFSGSRGGNTDLFIIEPTGARRRLFIEGSGLDVDPKFSPDGQYLAFVSGRYGNPHIFVSKIRWESETKPVVLDDKRLTYAGWYNSTPDWSPSGDKIVFAGYDKDIDRYDLFLMNPDGTKLERLTLKTGDNESPTWSPNGQLIMFQSNRKGSSNVKGRSGLYIMQRDGSNQRKLNIDLYESYTPTWSRR